MYYCKCTFTTVSTSTASDSIQADWIASILWPMGGVNEASMKLSFLYLL